jgi:hypothetical protein
MHCSWLDAVYDHNRYSHIIWINNHSFENSISLLFALHNWLQFTRAVKFMQMRQVQTPCNDVWAIVLKFYETYPARAGLQSSKGSPACAWLLLRPPADLIEDNWALSSGATSTLVRCFRWVQVTSTRAQGMSMVLAVIHHGQRNQGTVMASMARARSC